MRERTRFVPMGCRLKLLCILRSVAVFVGHVNRREVGVILFVFVRMEAFPIFCVCHQSDSEEMNEMYSTQQAEDNDYLPRNDEFIPPTNFAVIEKGLYRSIPYFLIPMDRCFPCKTELPVFEAFGNPFYSVWICVCVRMTVVESSFQKIILKIV